MLGGVVDDISLMDCMRGVTGMPEGIVTFLWLNPRVREEHLTICYG